MITQKEIGKDDVMSVDINLDLYKLFDIEENEEFDLMIPSISTCCHCKIKENVLLMKISKDYSDVVLNKSIWAKYPITINSLTQGFKVIHAPKFTDKEIYFLKLLDKEYNYIARDADGDIYLFTNKPYKCEKIWDCENDSQCVWLDNYIGIFEHISFNCVSWEDEEPVNFREIIDTKDING